jgi:hypothetical protein
MGNWTGSDPPTPAEMRFAESEMGMVVRFPIERARPAHENVFENEESVVLILPTVRIERDDAAASDGVDLGDGSPANGRRRAPRR